MRLGRRYVFKDKYNILHFNDMPSCTVTVDGVDIDLAPKIGKGMGYEVVAEIGPGDCDLLAGWRGVFGEPKPKEASDS